MPLNWIKLWVRESLDGSIRVDLTPAARSVWYELLLLGASSRRKGYIERSEGIPYKPAEIAARLMVKVAVVKSCINKCLHEGRLMESKEGTLFITNWARYQSGAPRVGETVKERELRERRSARQLARLYPEEVKDEVEPRVLKVDRQTGEVIDKQ